MTLRELVLKMQADENLLLRWNGDLLEATPETIINDFHAIPDLNVSMICWSQLFNAIMIELE